MPLAVGTNHRLATTVTEEMTADRFGNAGIPVLATPMLVGLVERACIEAIAAGLEPGQGSVGTRVEIRHLAATPVGFPVTLDVEVTSIEGRTLGFRVTGSDGVDTICEATHERALIMVDKFVARAGAKTPR